MKVIAKRNNFYAFKVFDIFADGTRIGELVNPTIKENVIRGKGFILDTEHSQILVDEVVTLDPQHSKGGADGE